MLQGWGIVHIALILGIIIATTLTILLQTGFISIDSPIDSIEDHQTISLEFEEAPPREFIHASTSIKARETTKMDTVTITTLDTTPNHTETQKDTSFPEESENDTIPLQVLEEEREYVIEIPPHIATTSREESQGTEIGIIENTDKSSFSDINIATRAAVVNILCTTKGGGVFSPVSGSGVIIDESGVILTNAHIAQYYLLQDYPTKDSVLCTIRIDSPAKPTYRAEPFYISKSWIENNATNIIDTDPKGTGEDDYAFLLITEHVNENVSLPGSFPSIEPFIDDDAINVDDNVLLAAYPAGFLGGIAIQKDLYAVSTITQIRELFTFIETTLDLFSIGGNIVAQQGSSGGAVVNDDGELLGIIVTSSNGNTTDERDLRAITLSHIDRSLQKNASTTLNTILEGDLRVKVADFSENLAPLLTDMLLDVLE